MLKRSKGRDQTRRDPWSSTLGVGHRANDPSPKNIMVTKTESDVNETTLLGDIAARAAMTLMGQNPRKPKGQMTDDHQLLKREDHGGGNKDRERKRSEFQCL